MKQRFYLNLAAAGALCLFASACAKKQVAVAPHTAAPVAAPAPDPAPAPAPVREFQREPQPVAAAPAPRYPDAATRARIDELLGHIQDAYFDYDRHTLRDDAVKTLAADSKELATILKQYPDYKLRVEGYCDERGSSEYNVALGEARAQAARTYLVTAGVNGDQLSTVSYGNEKQICNEHEESCWSKNRRVHIVAMK
ncbi:MAG: peptidoglycan-associated lipoprotein [Bryobacterales bacterium]|nr:peptidoglycan-associated lipoprotein [Bryobacterales bacterium]